MSDRLGYIYSIPLGHHLIAHDHFRCDQIMRYRLRTLMVVLALGPMVLAWWYGSHQHTTYHRVAATFTKMPDDDLQLKQWISSQPNVKRVHLSRRPDTYTPDRQRIEIFFETMSP